MRIFCLAMLILLAGCADPPTVFKPVEVEIPVAAPCKLAPPPAPASAFAALQPNASLFDKTRAALLELDQCRIYAAQLNAALQSCP